MTSTVAAAEVEPRVRTRCPVCAGRSRPLAGACPDAWLCSSCAHTYVGRLPTKVELDAAYAKYAYDDAEVRERFLPSFLDAILEDLVRSFEPHRGRGRFLDVGFGDGGFLRVAKRLGWDTHGIEFSPAAVEAARARGLGTLHAGDFSTVPLEAASFDVVVMSEVIEHLLEPMTFLLRAAEVLRPGGLLYMTTPHGRGVSGRTLGGSWSVLCPPEHLQLYSIESMRRSLVEAGFSKPRVFTQGILPHEIVAKLRARVRPPDPSHLADDPFARVSRSQDLNARFESGRLARVVKRAANGALRAARVGDSLRVRAIR